MSKIKDFNFSDLKRFFRDNEIKYLIHNDALVVNGSGNFPNLVFRFSENNYINVTRIPITSDNYSFAASNIYTILSQLLRFKLIHNTAMKKYYIRGIHGTGKPPKPNPLKVSENKRVA